MLVMNITVPSHTEQKKISLYFEQLDELITLHQRELKKLQKITLKIEQIVFSC